MIDDLEKTIQKTLAWFSIFHYPLTKEELYTLQWDGCRDITQLDFFEFLVKNQKKGIYCFKHGYYFLPGHEADVRDRQQAVRFVEKKIKRAVKAVRLLRRLPFIKAVFVCNTIAYSAVIEKSDIDVFIIIRAGRLWIGRALVTLLLSLRQMRRTKRKVADRICLSFYIADNNLDLQTIAISEPDIYLIYWLEQLTPIYDPDNYLQKIKQSNKWIKKYLSHSQDNRKMTDGWKIVDTAGGLAVKRFLERLWGGWYGDLIEQQARTMQQAKMKMNYMSVQNEPDSRVVVNDGMLKFHENDRRLKYQEQWLQKCMD